MASAMTSSMSTQMRLRLGSMDLLSAKRVRGSRWVCKVQGAARNPTVDAEVRVERGAPDDWLERADYLGGYALDLDWFAAGGVAGGVVEEHAAAVFAGEDGAGGFGVGAVVAEVVPALRADHHLAGGALLIEGLGDGGPLAAGDAVVVREGRSEEH